MGSAPILDILKIILDCSSHSVCRAILSNEECADRVLDLWAKDTDTRLMRAIDHCRPKNCAAASYVRSTACGNPTLLFANSPACSALTALTTEWRKP